MKFISPDAETAGYSFFMHRGQTNRRYRGGWGGGSVLGALAGIQGPAALSG